MNQMTLKELYQVGCSFETSVGEGSKSERARISKNSSRIVLNDELTNNIMSFDKEIKFLVAGEIWCPDYQLNGSVIKRFIDLNTNFNMSVITMARGKKFLEPILDIENAKYPLIVVLDKDFNILGSFQERPEIVKNSKNFDEIKLNYYKGQYLTNSANDIWNIIKNNK
ncbi:thioredoxin family protein [Terrisporobacter glycolicus]|uniref:Thioredoxin n=1 Tax=Terrisporobacter glycolicus ATCC 14880 = DSM 1288 TaxID=1121315 RepID=A0ABZ2EYX2_9FIRM|nr:thioredoxin family protein [Terrisporobacter glycolicus]